MKKISILLVVAMLLCMIPAFGVFAAEAEDYTIANADEYIAFVTALNDGTYAGGKSVKVTGDLDFSGKTYTAINLVPVDMVIDFGGHAIKNATYTFEANGDYAGNGELGFVANTLDGGSTVKNLVLKDSTFTVNGDKGNVIDADNLVGTAIGAICGRMNRAAVTNISTDNFTINAPDCTGYVGGLVALQHWTFTNTVVAYTGDLKGLTINAPKATVGILTGWTEDWDGAGMWVSVKDLSGNVTADGANDVTADTLFGKITLTKVDTEEFTENADQYYLDAASISVKVNEDAAGDPPAENPPAENPPATEPDPDDNKGEDTTPPQTGDVAVFAAVVAVIALAGAAVVSKKRSVR